VPDALIEEISIIGSPDEVRTGVKRWEEAGVTMLLVTRPTTVGIRQIADVVTP
jgi:alkanesulfonate monooxygenase SsuD/methylene tetrahydromethanopterin reductase-like flavin-dependent oxidoreductase (luciferase family)